jgi:hypothetical protein
MIWYSVLPANPTPITPSTEAIVAMMCYSLVVAAERRL